jgi:hypothetical protein
MDIAETAMREENYVLKSSWWRYFRTVSAIIRE